MNKINPTTTFVSKICCTILMLLSAFPVLASESGDANKEVSGVVVDKKTKDPLIGVNVAIWKDGTIETGVTTDFGRRLCFDFAYGIHNERTGRHS